MTPDYTTLEKSIVDASSEIGKTNREVRDRIETLDKSINTKTDELGAKVSGLTDAIKQAASSSTKLARAMVWLTVFLTIAAVIQAFVAALQLKGHSLLPTQTSLKTATVLQSTAP